MQIVEYTFSESDFRRQGKALLKKGHGGVEGAGIQAKHRGPKIGSWRVESYLPRVSPWL